MKLSEALYHPWLEGYESGQAIDYPSVSGTSNGSLSASEDVSMRTADELSLNEAESVSQGFEHLKLNGSSGVLPTHADANANTNGLAANGGTAAEEGRLTPSNTPPGLTLHKKGGLQRRSEVLAHAAETGRPLVEPSWEMINYAQSQSQDDLYRPAPAECSAGPSNGNANGNAPSMSNENRKGPNKRVHSELTPLSEEQEVEGRAASGDSSPLSSVGESPPPPPGPLKKKGKSTENAATPSKTRAKRGGKAAAPAPASARKVRARVDSSSADEQPAGTRRSTRAKSGKR
jgi:serine/threonine/tyrosine protein kinase RAD53